MIIHFMPIPMSTVAVFDFDKTLTTRDSLLPFLFFTHGWLRTSRHFIFLIPIFVQFLFNKQLRQNVKEQILTSFYAGCSFKTMQEWGQNYAHQQLDRYLNPLAMKRLAWHQAQGHRCLLISASLDLYLKPWAQRHGFEEILSSRLELNKNQQVTGRLAGLNCWGPEKKQKLLDYLGPKALYELYVYGDSQGDQDILTLADHPYYRTFE